jgi:hypothetical protein
MLVMARSLLERRASEEAFLRLRAARLAEIRLLATMNPG